MENLREPQPWRQTTQWAHDVKGSAPPMAPGPRNEGLDDRTLVDVKGVHAQLASFHDDELRQVPVMPLGRTLEHGATYFNLNDPGRGEFIATGAMAAGPDDLLIPKRLVSYELWNRLKAGIVSG